MIRQTLRRPSLKITRHTNQTRQAASASRYGVHSQPIISRWIQSRLGCGASISLPV
jgi:hypothetical protein